ncbi:MAG: glycoside hydrolase family 28 protein [Akkermansiaceae bacterium]|nr:glycoside hydrolase family 28 protein [Akkermansiaceae bacterium]
MTRRFFPSIAGALAALVFATPCSHAEDPSADAAWAEVPGILARIVPPTFPDADFPITDFGAVEGGTSDCGKAIAAAVAKCAESGGGRVVVPAGKFLTGPVHLRSKVELHLSEGSELVFSDRFEDFLPVVRVRVGGIDCFNYSPLVYAKDCTDIAITGKGRLNGNASKWWKWKGKETTEHFQMGAKNVPLEKRVFGTPEDAIRPNFVVLLNCRNILLEDFTIGSGPNWTIHPVYSENITIRGITVDTNGPNNDGIDPDSCRDLLIEHCTFSTGDDCVVLKSGYNEDGRRVGKPTENVIMRHCSSRHGHGGLVVGSEMSGGVRNVFMHDCDYQGTDRAIRIKSRRDRGGVVEKIYARDIKVRDMKNEVVILNMDYGADKNAVNDAKPPVFRDMCFERIEADGAPVAVRITGDPEATIDHIRFRDMRIAATEGALVRNASRIAFENLRLDVKKGPLFALDSVAGISIRNVDSGSTPRSFLKLDGSDSGDVVVSSCPVAKDRIELGKHVSKLAVTVK